MSNLAAAALGLVTPVVLMTVSWVDLHLVVLPHEGILPENQRSRNSLLIKPRR
jgi:hypothetical protein